MLTRKQEGFAQDVAKGETQTDAYRSNYDTQTPKDESVWQQASHVAGNVKVSSRISELVSKALETAIPKEQIANYINGKLVNLIEDGKNEGAKVQAAVALGKHVGMFREVVEAVETTKSSAELLSQAAGDDPRKIALLEELLGLDDEANTTH